MKYQHVLKYCDFRSLHDTLTRYFNEHEGSVPSLIILPYEYFHHILWLAGSHPECDLAVEKHYPKGKVRLNGIEVIGSISLEEHECWMLPGLSV